MKALIKVKLQGSKTPELHIKSKPERDIWNNISTLTECKFGWISRNLLKIFGDEYNPSIVNENQCEFIPINVKASKVTEVVDNLGGGDSIGQYPISIGHIFDLLKKQSTGGEGILRTDHWPNIFLMEGNEWRLGDTKEIKFTGKKIIQLLFVSYTDESNQWNMWSLPQFDGERLNSENCQLLVPSELNVTA